jgi:hypothetical protein
MASDHARLQRVVGMVVGDLLVETTGMRRFQDLACTLCGCPGELAKDMPIQVMRSSLNCVLGRASSREEWAGPGIRTCWKNGRGEGCLLIRCTKDQIWYDVIKCDGCVV